MRVDSLLNSRMKPINLNGYLIDPTLDNIKHRIFKSTKDVKTSGKIQSKKATKTGFSVKLIIETLVFGTILSIVALYPVSLYINPKYYNSNGYVNFDNLRLKSIMSMHVMGSPELGFNILIVSWPVWSDCGPVIMEIIHYDMVRKEIHIQILGSIGACPQIVMSEEHNITIFIPFLGSWEIFCNDLAMVISL
jgi:hypothetical protein